MLQHLADAGIELRAEFCSLHRIRIHLMLAPQVGDGASERDQRRQRREHGRLVVALEADTREAERGRAHQVVEHLGRMCAAVDIVAELHDPLGALRLLRVLDDLRFELVELVDASVHVADRVDERRTLSRHELTGTRVFSGFHLAFAPRLRLAGIAPRRKCCRAVSATRTRKFIAALDAAADLRWISARVCTKGQLSP